MRLAYWRLLKVAVFVQMCVRFVIILCLPKFVQSILLPVGGLFSSTHNQDNFISVYVSRAQAACESKMKASILCFAVTCSVFDLLSI